MEKRQLNICTTCGTAVTIFRSLPSLCPICNDDRQYIGSEGQQWTSLEALSNQRTIAVRPVSGGLYSLKITPSFAIGQRAFFIESKSGNILWDCIPFINDETVSFIRRKGGLKAIIISHPHYYSLMAEWAKAFDCKVYLHQADRQWVFCSDENIEFWNNERLELWDGIAVINTAGHFDGSCVLHLPAHHPGGILVTGDSLYVTRNGKALTFMYSYPNHIPLPARAIRKIRKALAGLDFERIYGAFEWADIEKDGRSVFDRSVTAYLAILDAS
ncbi:MAG TPA: MBL fold metallo-hydrolase [Sphingobacteriaceae bacterium]